MLEKFFAYAVVEKFEAFSIEHITAVVLIVFYWIGTIHYLKRKNRISKNSDNTVFCVTVAALLVVTELSNTAWRAGTGHFSITDSLPLQLCGLTIFTCAIMLVTGSYRFFEFNYFAGLGGALQAILTPDIERNFPHFEFFQLFIPHALIIMSVLYMLFIRRYLPTWKSAVKAFAFTNIYMGLIMIFNHFAGSNYMYVSKVPNFPTLIDLLVDIFGPHPYYIIGLEIICIVLFALLLLPVYSGKIFQGLKRNI